MSALVLICRAVAAICCFSIGSLAAGMTWYSLFTWEGRQTTDRDDAPVIALLWLLAISAGYGAFK